MRAVKFTLILFFVVFLVVFQPTRGGRGGGSRGGGSRGGSSGSRGSSSGSRGSSSSSSGTHGSSSSSSGSRGSSSGSSSSQGSSSNRGQYDYNTGSRDSRPSQPTPNVNQPQPVKPSAPELPRVVLPAPQTPGHIQPSNQFPHNPNYVEPRQPGPVVPQGNRSPHVNAAPGGHPGLPSNQGYPPHAYPPPSAPRENPPPYAPRENPPPYAPRQNPPPYAPRENPPPYVPSPHNPSMPQVPPNSPYPRQPGIVQPPGGYGPNSPYPRQPGMEHHPGGYGPNSPYPRQPGMEHHPGGFGGPNSPYPRQPGMVYPSGGYGSPNYFAPGGAGIKPHKKKGILGGLLSLGKGAHKKPKYHGSNPLGSYGGHGISPAHMALPIMVMSKPRKSFSSSNHLYWMLPYAAYRSHGWKPKSFGFDDDDDHYRNRCFRPRAPQNGVITCDRTLNGITCIANCTEGYAFPDNSTTKETRCWYYSGHWNASRYFAACKANCKAECQNGGSCKSPGVCRCPSEYRGDLCQYHIRKCNVRDLGDSSKLSWECSHARNETWCRINCRSPLTFESPVVGQYHCHINGTWTPGSLPKCIQGS